MQANPDGFETGFAVALAPQETTEHGDQSQDLIESVAFSRRLPFVKGIGAMPFILVEEQVGERVSTGPAESHQPRNAPGDDQVQRDVDRFQLQEHSIPDPFLRHRRWAGHQSTGKTGRGRVTVHLNACPDQ